MSELQKDILAAYYAKATLKGRTLADPDKEVFFARQRQWIDDAMTEFVRTHPDAPSVLLKSLLHTPMAQICEPIIFPENPFYFEIGFREAQS